MTHEPRDAGRWVLEVMYMRRASFRVKDKTSLSLKELEYERQNTGHIRTDGDR